MSIDPDKSFEVLNGLKINSRNNGDLNEGPLFTGGPLSPDGLDLPVNTFYLQITASGFLVWLKFGVGTSDWRRFDGQDLPFSNIDFNSLNIRDAIIESVQNAIDVPRSPIFLIHNGTLSNGQLVGYSNNVNTAPLIPFRGFIKEISFVNKRSTTDCDFRIYRNSETPANLIYTWELRNTLTSLVTDSSFTSPEFQPGDSLIIRYDDRGQNSRDTTLGFYWKVLN